MPPSDEGGGFCVSKTRRERNKILKQRYYSSLPQSKSQAISTAPSSEGAKHNDNKTSRQTVIYQYAVEYSFLPVWKENFYYNSIFISS